MEPVKINIATFEYTDKRLIVIMAAVAAFLVLITGVNINLFFTYKVKILEYGQKAAQVEKVYSEKIRQEKISIGEVGSEESERILQRAMEANRLILKDIFPWSRFLEILETSVPKGIVIQSILPSDDYKNLVLEGKATSERKVTFFLKRLKEIKFLNNSILTEFSIETDSGGKPKKDESNVSFSIKSDLLIENLFEQERYSEIVKSVMMPAAEKK